MSRIIRLQAENFKRLVAIDITPDRNVVKITGKNAQGKSSILDAIWATLQYPGKKELPQPVRKGGERGEVVVELDEVNLIVKRIFDKENTRLEITDKDGLPRRSPQTILDSFIGALSFDPLQFKEADEKTQLHFLMIALGVDVDKINEERQQIYDKRTQVNRALRELEAKTNVKPEEVKKIDYAALHTKWGEKNRIVKEAEKNIEEKNQAEQRIVELENQIQTLRKHITRLNDQIAVVNIVAARKEVEELETQIENANETNARAEAWQLWRDNLEYLKQAREESQKLTDKIANLDAQKTDALRKAKLPIDGLGFDEAGITLNGIQVKQISDSEQLKLSVAIAASLNPGLKVIHIRDGSLLDSTSMEFLENFAKKNDYQLWIEIVKEDGKTGIVIEEGMVKE